MITSLTLDLSSLKPAQRQALLALVESFITPQYVPTSDELAEHDAPVFDIQTTHGGRCY